MLRRSLSIILWGIFFLLLSGFMACGIVFLRWQGTPIEAALMTPALTEARQAIVVNFSAPILEGSFKHALHFEPALDASATWHDFGRQLVITPRENWEWDVTYRVTIDQARSAWFQKTPSFSFAVESPRQPRVVSITPSDQATDVLLGVEDPIRVELDRSARDFYVDFTLEPPMKVVYQNNPEKTVFEILPEGEVQPNTRYTLSVSLKWRDADDATYERIAQSSFTTLPPKPASLNRNLAERAAEAKRFTRAKKTEGKYIDINLASQVMTIFENGQALDSFIVSSGKRGMDTPKGEFAVHNKALRPWSKQYSLYMPYWMAITSDGKYGLHELPEWPGGYKEGANHLGTPVSHGCVRLGVGPAKRVFEWADIGTPIIVY